MKLATVQTPSGARAVVPCEDGFVDLHATEQKIPASVREILEIGPACLELAQELSQRSDAVKLDAQSVKLMAPVVNPRKIVCLGLNYKDHAAESGSPIPRDPVLFSKYPTALVGHEGNIELPAISEEVDFEAELVIVIGKKGRHIPVEEAYSYVAGYANGHDVSARDWQLKKDGKQWMAGKTFDTFAPVGPYLVTSDDVPDPHNLRIQLRLNGETMQDSNTGQMIFKVDAILAHLSKIFTLEPGDLIYTGTPPGVGVARKPPIFLKAGDETEVEIEHLGVLRNTVVQG